MINSLCFESFLKSLKPTNRQLNFFVDWEKCLKNKDEVSICLHHLNFLLGVSKENLKDKISLLFNEYPKAFRVLPIILALREKENILHSSGSICTLESYFDNIERIYTFICESGLAEIFASKKIQDLNDFVFGIEVGLDSNARKNRSGNAMESHLKSVFQQAGLHFKEQASIKEFSDLYNAFGDDVKRFDFVIFGVKNMYFIECNFYTSSGSKLNETASAYQDLAIKFKAFSHYKFIWITDGQGWLASKNKLQEAYKSVEIYNLSNVKDFIQKVQNDSNP